MLSLLLCWVITSYTRVNTVQKGIVRKAKRHVCARVCAGASGCWCPPARTQWAAPCPSCSTSTLTPTPSDLPTRREDLRYLAAAGNVPSGVTSPQRQDGVASSPPLGALGWMGTSPWRRWVGRTAVWIYVRRSGLQIYLQDATEDKEEPMGRRGASACPQPQPCRDFLSPLKQKNRAISDSNVSVSWPRCLRLENRYITWTGINGF